MDILTAHCLLRGQRTAFGSVLGTLKELREQLISLQSGPTEKQENEDREPVVQTGLSEKGVTTTTTTKNVRRACRR